MSIQPKLQDLASKWRKTQAPRRFPSFDHRVKSLPHTLVLLESPGPEVENSGIVSPFNHDPTAKELMRLIELAFDKREETGVLCWNAVPWFVDHRPVASDINDAKPLHQDLLAVVRPSLRFILLLGTTARDLLPFLSVHAASAQILGGHHPGKKAQIRDGLVSENEALFRLLRAKFARSASHHD